MASCYGRASDSLDLMFTLTGTSELLVAGVGPGTSLADKLNQAETYLNAGRDTDGCRTLSAFVHEAIAQAGKSIPLDTANTLAAHAEGVRRSLGC